MFGFLLRTMFIIPYFTWLLVKRIYERSEIHIEAKSNNYKILIHLLFLLPYFTSFILNDWFLIHFIYFILNIDDESSFKISRFHPQVESRFLPNY